MKNKATQATQNMLKAPTKSTIASSVRAAKKLNVKFNKKEHKVISSCLIENLWQKDEVN